MKGKKERKRKLFFRSVPTRPINENSKKIATKFIKVLNTLMDSFQAKIGWKRLRKSEKKKLSFRFVLTRRVIKNFKKVAKKFKKLKNTIMASFQSKIHRRPRKGENKNYCFVSFSPDA